MFGNGFVALVEFSGRLLARQESEGIWIDGVNPGGFAIGAASFHDAGQAVRDALTLTLIDFAAEATTFEAFEAEVERFFHETDAASVTEWTVAVEAVRSQRLQGPPELPVESADAALVVRVVCKSTENVSAQDNPTPEPVLKAAA